eukprot:5222848-Amphidinium_carterae.1
MVDLEAVGGDHSFYSLLPSASSQHGFCMTPTSASRFLSSPVESYEAEVASLLRQVVNVAELSQGGIALVAGSRAEILQ